MRAITVDDKRQAVFGIFDGESSALGAFLALVIAGYTKGLIIAALAFAVGAGVSMAGGEWLSDNQRSFRRAFMMGLATFFGSILPAIPLFLNKNIVGIIFSILIGIGLGGIISYLRPEPQPESLIKTFSILLASTGLALGTSLLVGVS